MADSTARDLVGWLVAICAILVAVIAAMVGHITTVQAMAGASEAVKTDIVKQVAEVKKELRAEFVPRTEVQARLDTITDTLTDLKVELTELRKARERGGK